MAVVKDGKRGWRVVYRYITFTGELKQSTKRGFKTKKEAQKWEEEYVKKSKFDLGMTFGSFAVIYQQDMQDRVRKNTWRSKADILRTKILPYFEKRKLSEIQPRDIISWQNEIIRSTSKSGKPFSQDYLRSINSQLSAIFNHAVNFYDLPSNPVKKAGSMGKKGATEMQFWTQEEYEQFAEAMMDKPVSFYAFEMLYWTGCRCGELLSLTVRDIDFVHKKLRINKSHQRYEGEDEITDPKSKKSKRTIDLPEFLVNEMLDYIKMQYGIQPNDRLFTCSRGYLHHEMNRGTAATGVKRIRIHDLRHSHVSLLIELGYSAVAIAERLGHESIDITLRYAHMFPSVQKKMAVSLDTLRKGKLNVSEE